MLEGKQGDVNKALHLFAATELRKAYGAGDAQLASLGEPFGASRLSWSNSRFHCGWCWRPLFKKLCVVLDGAFTLGALRAITVNLDEKAWKIQI